MWKDMKYKLFQNWARCCVHFCLRPFIPLKDEPMPFFRNARDHNSSRPTPRPPSSGKESWQVSTDPTPLQVCSLTQFFFFLFCLKNHWLACVAWINDPSSGRSGLLCSSKQLPCLSLSPLKGFLNWHGTVQGSSTCLMRCFQDYSEKRTPSGVSRYVWRSQVTVNQK